MQKKVSEMRRNLENIQLLVRKGSIAEAKNDINEVIAYLTTHSQTENLLAVEAAQSLNAAILSYVNRNGMISLIVEAEHSRCDRAQWLISKTTGTFSE